MTTWCAKTVVSQVVIDAFTRTRALEVVAAVATRRPITSLILVSLSSTSPLLSTHRKVQRQFSWFLFRWRPLSSEALSWLLLPNGRHNSNRTTLITRTTRAIRPPIQLIVRRRRPHRPQRPHEPLVHKRCHYRHPCHRLTRSLMILSLMITDDQHSFHSLSSHQN